MDKIYWFWFGQFTFSWAMWFIFAKRGRWREYLPTCILASFTSVLVETGKHFYPLWKYAGHPLLAFYINAFGVYIIVMYLFLQWLPRERTLVNMVKYWFMWVLVVIIFELIHIWSGYMWHLKWWNIGYSYIADWFLFWVFYRYHIFINKRRNGQI